MAPFPEERTWPTRTAMPGGRSLIRRQPVSRLPPACGRRLRTHIRWSARHPARGFGGEREFVANTGEPRTYLRKAEMRKTKSRGRPRRFGLAVITALAIMA